MSRSRLFSPQSRLELLSATAEPGPWPRRSDGNSSSRPGTARFPPCIDAGLLGRLALSRHPPAEPSSAPTTSPNPAHTRQHPGWAAANFLLSLDWARCSTINGGGQSAPASPELGNCYDARGPAGLPTRLVTGHMMLPNCLGGSTVLLHSTIAPKLAPARCRGTRGRLDLGVSLVPASPKPLNRLRTSALV